MTSRLHQALSRIDEINRGDPRTELVLGQSIAVELLYSHRMSDELNRFSPNAGEVLQIAVRGQHVARWKSPRTDFPSGLVGYKRWRTALAKFHADTVAASMREVGYGIHDIERAETLLRKRGIKSDPEVQVLEDVACLVFLRHYLGAFAIKHEREKLINIIRKTWAKMSEAGHRAATQIEFEPQVANIVKEALV